MRSILNPDPNELKREERSNRLGFGVVVAVLLAAAGFAAYIATMIYRDGNF